MHPPAARAQSRAHGNFRPACDPSRELEIRDICAYYEKDEKSRTHDELVVKRRYVAVDVIEQRLNSRRPSLVGCRVCIRQPLGNESHLRLRRFLCCPVTQTAKNHVIVVAAIGKLSRDRSEG